MSSSNKAMIESSRKLRSKNICGKCIPETLFLAATTTTTEDNEQIDLDFLYRYDRSQIEVRQCQSRFEFFLVRCKRLSLLINSSEKFPILLSRLLSMCWQVVLLLSSRSYLQRCRFSLDTDWSIECWKNNTTNLLLVRDTVFSDRLSTSTCKCSW